MKQTIFTVAMLGLTAITAHASDYGCTVLLCLSNPAGPMAVAECVPPITRLYRDLAKGRPFPTCEEASGPNGNSYAQPGYSYYDPCPAGTTALPPGQFAVSGGVTYAGIGTGQNQVPADVHGDAMPPEICVGKQVGRTTAGTRDDTVQAGIYDTVHVLEAHGSPNVIDVYVDDKLFTRVRY